MLTYGPCNKDQWGPRPPLRQDIPWSVPRGNILLWQGQLLHNTHHLAWKSGIVFCKRCAMYSELRVKGLCYECNVKPTKDYKRSRILNRIYANRHPRTGEPIRLEAEPYCRPSWCEDEVSDEEDERPVPSGEVPRAIPEHTPGAVTAPPNYIWPATGGSSNDGLPTIHGPWPVYRIGPAGEELPPEEPTGDSSSD